MYLGVVKLENLVAVLANLFEFKTFYSEFFIFLVNETFEKIKKPIFTCILYLIIHDVNKFCVFPISKACNVLMICLDDYVI